MRWNALKYLFSPHSPQSPHFLQKFTTFTAFPTKIYPKTSTREKLKTGQIKLMLCQGEINRFFKNSHPENLLLPHSLTIFLQVTEQSWKYCQIRELMSIDVCMIYKRWNYCFVTIMFNFFHYKPILIVSMKPTVSSIMKIQVLLNALRLQTPEAPSRPDSTAMGVIWTCLLLSPPFGFWDGRDRVQEQFSSLVTREIASN